MRPWILAAPGAAVAAFLFLVQPAAASQEMVGCYSFKGPGDSPYIVITRQGNGYAVQFLGSKPWSEPLSAGGAGDRSDIEQFVGEMVGAGVRALVVMNDIESTYALLDREVAYKDKPSNRTRYAAFDWEFGPSLMFRVACSR